MVSAPGSQVLLPGRDQGGGGGEGGWKNNTVQLVAHFGSISTFLGLEFIIQKQDSHRLGAISLATILFC